MALAGEGSNLMLSAGCLANHPTHPADSIDRRTGGMEESALRSSI